MIIYISIKNNQVKTNMTLKEYLKENEPYCIHILMAKKNGGIMSVEFKKNEYNNKKIISENLLEYEVAEVNYLEDDNCTEIWLIGGVI